MTLKSWKMSLLLLTVSVAVPAMAQETRVSGTVKDTSGAALTGTTVTALSAGTGISVSVTVGQGASYEIKGLPAGQYRLTARLPGFSDQGRSIALKSGGATEQSFVLSLGALSEEITVTAAKGDRAASDIPQVITVVSEADIDTRRPAGVQEAIERAPSMRNADPNPYRTRPQFRGLQGSRVLIVVDGERLNNSRFGADFGGISPSLVDPSQIKSIEVVGGSSSSLWGSDAIAGTVNIVTKGAPTTESGKIFDGRGDFDFGTNNEFKRGILALGLGGTKWGVRGSFSQFDYDSFKNGGEAVTKDQVLNLGRFSAQVGAVVGRTNIVTQYPVYDIPANYKIPNSGGKGSTANFDVKLLPNSKQEIRLRYINNRYKNLGIPTGGAPFDFVDRGSKFQNYDKFGGRYDIREVASWLPKISIGAYRQYYERSQNDTQSVLGGSFATVTTFGPTGPVSTTQYTGQSSTFTKSLETDTIDHNETLGGDLQLNIIPFHNAQFTTGVAYSNDKFDGNVAQRAFSATGVQTSSISGVTNVPNTDYKNVGWFNQLELFPSPHIRFSAGVRVDNWKSEAKPTTGFATTAGGAVRLGLPALRRTPGGLNPDGANGIEELIAGTASIKSNSNITTGNIGATFPLAGGVTPYVRYATSYREPDATSRYLVRNFGSAIISILGLPNTTLKPERGKNIEAGVKIERPRFRGTLGYYENKLTDAILTSFSSSLCIPASPALGVLPTPFPPCSFAGQHSATFFQATNTAQATLKGWEFVGEGSVALGNAGSLTPGVVLSSIKATNKTPDADRVAIINNFYGKPGLPFELEGSATDVPFNALPNLQGNLELRFTNRTAKWWAGYEYYFTSKITRIDPNNLASGGISYYHLLASYYGIKKHSVRAGLTLGSKANPVHLTAAVENLTDNLYFAPQQPSYAMGRTVKLGATFNWKKPF